MTGPEVRPRFKRPGVAGLLGGVLAYFVYAALFGMAMGVANASNADPLSLSTIGLGLLLGLALGGLGLIAVIGFFFLAAAILAGCGLMWALARLGWTSVAAFVAGGAVVGLIVGGAMGAWIAGENGAPGLLLANVAIGVVTGVVCALAMRSIAKVSVAPTLGGEA